MLSKISTPGPNAGTRECVVTAQFLRHLRDPVRIARAKERDEHIEAELAEQAAWRTRLPADRDLAAIVEVAAEICSRIEAHIYWHSGRASARELPLYTSAHRIFGDVIFYASQLRDALPDAADDALRTMFGVLFNAVRRLRSAEEDAWLLQPNLTREQWRSRLEAFSDEQLDVAGDQVAEIGEGDLLPLVNSLGMVLDLLRNARVGFELKFIDDDDNAIVFAEVPLAAADAWRRAIEILAYDTPGYAPQTDSGAAQWH